MTTRDYIRPRAYDKRIQFQVLSTTTGTLGGAKRAWSFLYGGRSFWASMTDIRGKLRRASDAGGGSIPEASFQFETRWRSLVVADTVRVLYGDDAYMIKFVEDTHRQKDRMILHCDVGARRNG